MSLVSIIKGISLVEAQRFVNVLDTGIVLVREVVEKMKDDGRLSGREGLEILGKALEPHGICLGCDGAGQRRHDDVRAPDSVDVRHPLRLKDEAETPERLSNKLAELEGLVDRGVSLAEDGEPSSYRVSQRSSDVVNLFDTTQLSYFFHFQ
ncbi:MAG: hypothetical protein ABW170_16850 [Candidatus Thiodiazotropha sp. L084R]